jgi:hypothetical protein
VLLSRSRGAPRRGRSFDLLSQGGRPAVTLTVTTMAATMSGAATANRGQIAQYPPGPQRRRPHRREAPRDAQVLRRSPVRPRLFAVIASRRTEGAVIARLPANSSGWLTPIHGDRGGQPEQHVQAFGENPPSTAHGRSNGPPGLLRRHTGRQGYASSHRAMTAQSLVPATSATIHGSTWGVR